MRCEKYEVDSLKSKAAEMSASGNQTQAAAQAQQILNQYDQTADRIRVSCRYQLPFIFYCSRVQWNCLI